MTPASAASAGSRSDAELVMTATRTMDASSDSPPVAGMIRGASGRKPLRFAGMDRSLWAVIGGTFTLRFSTGLTGAMLAAYLAKLPGQQPVDAFTVGIFAATFYLAELVLSPFFGALSDRIGHHKVMLYGPVFGAVAVILTAFTTNLLVLGGTRWLEGASTAASVPSILGYIAMVTANDQALRGRAAARFEGATLLGLAAGIVVAPVLFAAIGPAAFLLNALVYGISFLIYWRGVGDPAGEAQTLTEKHYGVHRYVELLRSSHVWLLAPTWIAVNASIGLWFSQSIFQLTAANPEHPDQLLHGGFEPWQISLGALVVGLIFGAGLLYWGNRFKRFRRTTIILYGILGGAVLVGAGLVINHSAGLAPLLAVSAGARRRLRPVRAGGGNAGRARPAGRRLGALSRRIAARSWASIRSSSPSARSSVRSSAARQPTSAASTRCSSRRSRSCSWP